MKESKKKSKKKSDKKLSKKRAVKKKMEKEERKRGKKERREKEAERMANKRVPRDGKRKKRELTENDDRNSEREAQGLEPKKRKCINRDSTAATGGEPDRKHGFEKEEQIHYRTSSGQLVPATVVAVHYDDVELYYTIRTGEGERQTVASRMQKV